MPLQATTIVGLGTLGLLKSIILPGPVADGTDRDVQLAAIGRSVAAQFDKYTNRTLARGEDLVWEGSADCSFVVLPAYPLEKITKLESCYAAVPLNVALGWSDDTANLPASVNKAAGLVDFGFSYASLADYIRFTYTGAYWIDDTLDGSGECPEGVTPLPPDLSSAWTLQCATELQARDVFGMGVVRDTNIRSAAIQFASGLTLAPQVIAILNTYRRLAI